ncbi:XRN-Two Binding Domain XTBD [Trinorchestia longiramus]|nr:XRN-Two Binding Domain XTBD [Trinorchestia longiramus]
MVVDTDWDIDQYRTKFEPTDHWNLKKEFMETHKSLIEEDRLVCLAQVYANIELLGCKYPLPVFRQVQALSQGLGSTYKARRAGKLQRTFVGASDAAGAKARRDGTQAKFQTGLRCEENALERQRQRKPVRHADPQQELRSPKTASRRGDPSEPRPLCDVDEELKARRQTEDLLLEASVSAAKDGASKGRPEKKKRTSLKKKDSFRVKKACSPVETSQFFEDEKNEREKKGEEEEVFSSEKESVLEEKKVSVLDGATPTVFKKEGSPQVVESSVEENYSSSVHGKFSSLEVNETNEKMGLACEKSSFADDNKESSFADDNKENSFADDNKENSSADDNMNSSADDNKENSSADDTKENSFAADNKNSFADDNKENSFADNNTEKGSMEQRCTSESSVRKRVVREDPVDNMEVGAKLSKLGDKEACEAGAWQLDRSPVKDCGVSSTEVKKVDCALSPTEVQKVDCGLSPPASPVSTGSSDSQSSLGDFTMVQ